LVVGESGFTAFGFYIQFYSQLNRVKKSNPLMSQPYRISLKSTWQNILSDLSRYHVTDKRSYAALVVMCPGVIAGIYYRIGHWIWYPAEVNPTYLYLLRPFYMLGKRLVEVYAGASLSTQARIGRGLYIGHFGSIFIGASVIGENCTLSHEVTIGVAGRSDERGLPTIGDRMFIGAGAKIIGPITVGNDVAVGANAVVMMDLPDCAVAAGIPAKIISYKGSFDFVLYENMEIDPPRLNSIHEHALWQSSRPPLQAREKVSS
jgi:serine O-acetyltransferase